MKNEPEDPLPISARGLAKKQPRVVHVFDIPASLQKHGVKSIGLHELTPRDEQIAAKRAGGDKNRLALELVQQSLAEVDGQTVSTGDGSAEAAMAGMHPKLRNLVMEAYADIHIPGDEVTSDFLQSHKARV